MTMQERLQIANDEGVRYRSYLDTRKFLTGGVGHLLTEREQKLYPLGSPIPSQVVETWFDEDMIDAADSASRLLSGIKDPPDELHDIITNMAFNLGEPKLRQFRKMWEAIYAGDYEQASKEMRDSRWFYQVRNRAIRLCDRMKALQKGKEDVDSSNTSVGKPAGEDTTRPESGC